MIFAPSMRGMVGGAGTLLFDPASHPNVVEIYNAWDESLHTYYPARTAASYEAAGGVVTLTCDENPTGFSTVGVSDVVVVDTGNSEVDGEFTITSASGATITYDQPSVTPTGSPVSLSGTVQWKHRKVQSVDGMKGAYAFVAASIVAAPQWDATAKEMLSHSDRSTMLSIPAGLRAAICALNTDRSVIAYGRMDSDSGTGGMFSTTDGTGSGNTYISMHATGTQGTLVVAGSAGEWATGIPIRNGDHNLYCVSGTTAPSRDVYINDMVSAAASSGVTSWVNTGNETRQLGIFRGRVNGSIKGFVNLIIFMSGAVADQVYRENVKAWVQSYGATFG